MSLPNFPILAKPTEDGLERIIESLMDRADDAFMNGGATEAEYNAWLKSLNVWADSWSAPERLSHQERLDMLNRELLATMPSPCDDICLNICLTIFTYINNFISKFLILVDNIHYQIGKDFNLII